MLYSSSYLPREPRQGEARIVLPATGATSLGPALDARVALAVGAALAKAHPNWYHRLEVGSDLSVDPPEWTQLVARTFLEAYNGTA